MFDFDGGAGRGGDVGFGVIVGEARVFEGVAAAVAAAGLVPGVVKMMEYMDDSRLDRVRVTKVPPSMMDRSVVASLL